MRVTTFGPAGVDRHARSSELAAVGPVIDVRIGDVVLSASLPARGLIDTGASVVCIDRRLALRLGLRAVNQADVQIPGGLTMQSTVYAGRLIVPALGFDQVMPLYSAGMQQVHHDVLLGRAFLRNFIVSFDGPAGVFHFSRPATPLREDDDFAT